MRDDRNRIVPASIALFLIWLGLFHWYANWPPTLASADRVEGRVIRHAPILKPNNGLISRNDVLTIDTGKGLRDVFVRARAKPYGVVIGGAHVVARIDRSGWVMGLDVEGVSVLDFESRAIGAKRQFWAQTMIGAAVLGLLGLLIVAQLQLRLGDGGRKRHSSN